MQEEQDDILLIRRTHNQSPDPGLQDFLAGVASDSECRRLHSAEVIGTIPLSIADMSHCANQIEIEIKTEVTASG